MFKRTESTLFFCVNRSRWWASSQYKLPASDYSTHWRRCSSCNLWVVSLRPSYQTSTPMRYGEHVMTARGGMARAAQAQGRE